MRLRNVAWASMVLALVLCGSLAWAKKGGNGGGNGNGGGDPAPAGVAYVFTFTPIAGGGANNYQVGSIELDGTSVDDLTSAIPHVFEINAPSFADAAIGALSWSSAHFIRKRTVPVTPTSCIRQAVWWEVTRCI